MNIKLFNKVKKHIQERPKELVMDYFCQFSTELFKAEGTDYANHSLSRLSCGTVGCIAGTGIFCSFKKSERPTTKAEYEVFEREHLYDINIPKVAKLFDIPQKEADALFYFPFPAQERVARYGDDEESDIALAYSDVRTRLKSAIPGTKKYANIVLEAIDICIERCKSKKVVTLVPAKTYQ